MLLADSAPSGSSFLSCTDSHLLLSSAAAPPLAPPLLLPLCHVLYYCTIMPSSNPVIGHMLHIFSTTAVSGILSPVPDPNMIHCLHQQPLARTVRTPHLHKPVLPGSSLTPTFNLLARSYLSLRKPAVNPFLNTGQNYLYAYMILCKYTYQYHIRRGYANIRVNTSVHQSRVQKTCPKNKLTKKDSS